MIIINENQYDIKVNIYPNKHFLFSTFQNRNYKKILKLVKGNLFKIYKYKK